jgi:hypothetical protein
MKESQPNIVSTEKIKINAQCFDSEILVDLK